MVTLTQLQSRAMIAQGTERANARSGHRREMLAKMARKLIDPDSRICRSLTRAPITNAGVLASMEAAGLDDKTEHETGEGRPAKTFRYRPEDG